MASLPRLTTTALPRRTLLRGMAGAMGLPLLEAMLPPGRALAAGTGARAVPRRLAFVYVPNGATMADFTPQADGADFELPPILAPLAPVRSEVLVLSGLAHKEAESRGDGGGAHASASATYLTATHSRRRTAVDIRVGVSVDQVCAGRIGHLTRLASLELSCDKGQQAGICDSGCSCAYQFNLAWKTPTTPMPPEVDPRLVFERLFGGGDDDGGGDPAVRRRNDRSILDFVMADMRRLGARVSGADRRKLDEFAGAVRAVEQQIVKAETMPVAHTDYSKPTAIPREYAAHTRVMFDLMTLAFQTDTTRVSTFMMAHDGSNRSYPFIGVPEGHHDTSHHGGDPHKKAKIALINRFHMEQFAYWLGRMRAIKEGDGSLLDNSMIVYGSGICDGDKHNHFDLPVVLAGRGGGTLAPGRHVRHEKYTPMANLYLSLLERMGTPVEKFGDSRGVLPGLTA